MVSATPTKSEIIDIEKPTLYEDAEIESHIIKSATDVVATARCAYLSGKTRSIEFRKNQLQQLWLLLEENSVTAELALHQDLNRHPSESRILEIDYLKGSIMNTLMHLDDWVKPEKPKKPLKNLFDKMRIYNDSLGVVLVISSWNFPFHLLLVPVIGAIAAGNCVIIKPSEVAIESESVIAKLVPKYLDKECYQVFVGGVEKMNELLTERFDHIFFTGSIAVGRIIHKAANKYLTPVTLELGGKSPTYIDESVNLKVALRRILWGKFTNAGQICMSPDYLLCTQELRQKIISVAPEVVKEFYGDDVQSSPDFCRIINNNHFRRLMKFLNKKGNIAMGGKFDESERFIEPTILVNVSSNDPIMQEEIFGPILPIITVNSPEEAIDFINRGEKPLIIHVFTLDAEVKNLFTNHTSSGVLAVNDILNAYGTDTLPFGGVGFSGMGCCHGKFSYDTFTHKKAVHDTTYMSLVDKLLSTRYPPYSKTKEKICLTLIKPRNLKFFQYINSIIIFICGSLFVIIITSLFNTIKK